MAEKKSGSSEKLLYCSFCGKSQHEVKKLIAGPSVFICDECIELCNDIIRDEIAAEPAGTAKRELPAPKEIRDMLDQYYGDKGHYPPTLETLVEIGYARQVPFDPITKSNTTWELILDDPAADPEAAPAETDLPEGGEPGILDVRSGSGRVALDGTPYAEW